MYKLFFFICTLLFTLHINAQDCSLVQLLEMEDEELLSYFTEVESDSIAAGEVARIYLDRGRKEDDTIKMARGYDRLARIYSPKTSNKFADSIIFLTKNNTTNISYPSLGYMLKAKNYYLLGDFNLAQKFWFKSYKESKRTNNLSHQIYVLDQLIFNKVIWGNKNEALLLQREKHKLLTSDLYRNEMYLTTRKSARHLNDEFYKKELIDSYLSYAICHHYLKNNDSTEYYIARTKNMLKDFFGYGGEGTMNRIHQILMEHNFYKKKYKISLKYADSLLNSKKKKIGNGGLFGIYLFKGLSYYELGKKQIGIEFLNKSDSVYSSDLNFPVQNQDRLLFIKLKNHYSKEGNLKREIYYLNKLIRHDSILNKKYNNFENDIIRNIEIPQLISEKDGLIKVLQEKEQKSRAKNLVILGGFFVLLTFAIYYFKKQQVYKKRFQKLMLSQENKLLVRVFDINTKMDTQNISTEIVEELLEKLDRFERNKKYLNANLTLNKLAKDLNTNSNYLSRVINLKMEKNFSQYLNDLRIEYALQELKINKTFRKYSIKAIAQECGFNSGSSFSRVFYNNTGIQPSYYLKKLEKEVI